MRFCQVDGTPLVDDAPAFDPYATIVAPAGIAVPPTEEEPVVEAPVEAAPVADESEAATQIAPFPESSPIAEPSDVLDLPAESDPLKTMYVSEDEMKQALGEAAPVEEDIMELPSVEPDPPAFIEPAVAAPPSPFDAPPPSPMSDQSAIPSPFSNNEPVVEVAPEPEVPVFNIPEPTPPPFAEPQAPVFEQPSAPAPMEWTPPPAPDAAWQNQPVGSETPFAPPVAGAAAPSQGLAIGSMVCGILSCLCCISILTGPAGVIMGYIARKKANEDPANYGGATFATVGMITGVIGFIIGTAALILQVFFGVLSNIR
jgi:hypothetical protein